MLNTFTRNCLVEIHKANKTIRDNLARIVGFEAAMDATFDEFYNATRNDNLILGHNEFAEVRPTPTILEEVRQMIIELKIKGSIRERTSGLIELRTVALGSIYGRTREEIELKLNKRLKETKKKTKTKEQFNIPTNFDKFAQYWFENFHKRKVAAETYKKNLDTYNRNIQKEFAKDKLANILPVRLQNFLDGFSDKARTKETLYSILNQIFGCAVKHGILRLNPLGMVFYQKHQRKHGKALSKEDEKRLLATFADTPYQIDFAIALYTGLRPNEYSTATIDGNFVKAKNSKRKDGKVEFKRIPITPMLRPYLANVTELKLHHPNRITEKFKLVLPNNQLYDLRTTFQTRCTECGVSEVAIGLFMGNAIGGELKKAYTDISDEYLLCEGNKLNY